MRMKYTVEFFGEKIGVGETLYVRKICVILEWNSRSEMNELISREEVERYLKGQRNAKAAGEDEILWELYKNDGEFGIDGMR